MDKRRAGLIALVVLVAAGLLVGGYITAEHWIAVATQAVRP